MRGIKVLADHVHRNKLKQNEHVIFVHMHALPGSLACCVPFNACYLGSCAERPLYFQLEPHAGKKMTPMSGMVWLNLKFNI